MGKKARRIIGVVAAIAVPYLAPKIAATVFASTAINATVASALTGAVMGAGAAAIGGTDIAQGALMGGIGGGISGYIQSTPAQAQTTVAQSAGVTPGSAGMSAAPGSFQSAIADLGVSTSAVPPVAPTSSILPAAPPIASFGGMTPAPGSFQAALPELGITPLGAPPAYTPAPGSFQAALPDFGVALSTPTAPPSYFTPAPTPTAGVVPGGDPYIAGSTAADFSESAANIAAEAPTAPAAISTPAPAPTPTPTTFTQALKQVPGEIAAKFQDPKALADLTLRAAGQLAGAAFAGDGLSPQERQLLEAERADLERLRTENESLFRERLAAAQNLMGESKYFDPEYFGLQSARRAQLAGARSRKAGLRGLRGRQRDVAARQYDIETARTTGTAYDVGAQTGLTGRLQTQQAGLSMMPTSFPSVSYAGLRGAYDSAAERRAKEVGGTQRLFGSFTGIA
jgi:hypothetical protein